MRKTLLNAVKRKPQVMVKITSFAGSKEGLAAHLDYLSRNGKNEVQSGPHGEPVSGQRALCSTRLHVASLPRKQTSLLCFTVRPGQARFGGQRYEGRV